MVKIVWTEQAIDDLLNIADFESRYSEKYASAIISRLFYRPNILKNMPLIGRIVPEKENKNLRELIEGNYRIIYRYATDKNRVEILTVHHSARPLNVNL